ncbi:hypothetical protein J9N36_004355 [Salmonella enterica]|uniref:Uncharacterized protein n=1 Tax=Salmonella newport TaxID=108619 RepID=A0A5U9VT05_SALNE|nr:hypothetical protein [Salmonella enterica subsp. enterica serovar Newport]ECB3302068.1 hypothetical protein [Salmonella enterica subsp. enterica serovar Newport]EHI3122926.1 hypothetical protein [Salmonella enterica]
MERPFRIMEVCGGRACSRYLQIRPRPVAAQNFEFIHGPGCLICVWPMGRIESFVEIFSHPKVIFCT